MAEHPERAPMLVLAVVAALFLAFGRPVAAVVALVSAPLLAQALTLSPRFVAFVHDRFSPGVARAVALVLLAPVYLLVFVPAAAIGRLLGTDPLGEGRWLAPAAGRPRSTRAYGDDRGRRRPGGGWRVGLALFLTGALAATIVPRLLDDEVAQPPEALQGGGFDAMSSPALADAEWAPEAAAEFGESVARNSTYTPYTAASSRDYAGRHVNITDRQRRSYEADVPDGETPLEVWFFGGSTMFGFSAQRDQHTIASEVVRLAEDDGLWVRARNFGAPGVVNFQETVLLTQLLLAGERPDVVVFYDGINDLGVQLHHAYGGLGELGEVSDLSAPTMRELLAGRYTGSAEPPDNPFPSTEHGRPPTNEDVARAVGEAYGQGVELARILADEFDFALAHFWQPTMFTTDRLLPGEAELLEPLHLDGGRYEAFVALSAEVAAALPSGVTDLAGALDGRTEAVLTDQVHTNEAGARMVAEAVYARLRATGALPS